MAVVCKGVRPAEIAGYFATDSQGRSCTSGVMLTANQIAAVLSLLDCDTDVDSYSKMHLLCIRGLAGLNQQPVLHPAQCHNSHCILRYSMLAPILLICVLHCLNQFPRLIFVLTSTSHWYLPKQTYFKCAKTPY